MTDQKLKDILARKRAQTQTAATQAAASPAAQLPAADGPQTGVPASKATTKAAPKLAAAKAGAAKATAKAATKAATKAAPAPKRLIKFSEIKHAPKLNKDQQAAYDSYEVVPDTYSANLKPKQVKDDLGRLLKPDVITTDQMFDMARKYGVSDSDIKRYKKTPNAGLCRMSLGNRLRHLCQLGLTEGAKGSAKGAK
jgi:hypothetical protein